MERYARSWLYLERLLDPSATMRQRAMLGDPLSYLASSRAPDHFTLDQEGDYYDHISCFYIKRSTFVTLWPRTGANRGLLRAAPSAPPPGVGGPPRRPRRDRGEGEVFGDLCEEKENLHKCRLELPPP